MELDLKIAPIYDFKPPLYMKMSLPWGPIWGPNLPLYMVLLNLKLPLYM